MSTSRFYLTSRTEISRAILFALPDHLNLFYTLKTSTISPSMNSMGPASSRPIAFPHHVSNRFSRDFGLFINKLNCMDSGMKTCHKE